MIVKGTDVKKLHNKQVWLNESKMLMIRNMYWNETRVLMGFTGLSFSNAHARATIDQTLWRHPGLKHCFIETN